VEGFKKSAAAAGVPIQANHRGTMFGFYFLNQTGVAINDYASAKQYADTGRYGRFFHAMLEQGFYFAPSQFEAGFMSIAHDQADIEATVQAAQDVLKRI
jgi:glutamate-1-semialdehyde 2,1-aminomutase